jgi:integrase/recombinase XerD
MHDTGCWISEALALTSENIDLSGRAVMFESPKKRRRGIYRAVPVPPSLLDTLDMVHGILEARKREDSPTAYSGRGRAIPRGGTSRP